MEKKNIFTNKNISLRAKGLYGTISILKDNPNFSKQFLLDYLEIGEYSFRMAWNELKENGYLEIHKYSDNGKFCYKYKIN